MTSQTRAPTAPAARLRARAALSIGISALVLTSAALLAGLASWSSRPEAWALGLALPARASFAWAGIATPVLFPAAAALGAFLAARRGALSGELDAWRGLGVGPWGSLLALGPVWCGVATLALGAAWVGEPAAWSWTVQAREAASGGLLGAGAVGLADGGVLIHSEDTVRLRMGEVRATAAGVERAGGTVLTGPLTVSSPSGTWTASRATLRATPVPRPMPPLARRSSLDGAVDARARGVMHRRLATPALVFALCVVGWSLGGSLRRRAGGAGLPTLVATLVGLGLLGRAIDASDALPPATAWVPALLALGVAGLSVHRGSG